MLWTIAIVLFALWILGIVFKIAGGIIHILLIIGIVLIAFHFLKGRVKGGKY